MLPAVPIACQECLDIRSFLHGIHQLHKSVILLQPFSAVLREILVVDDLVQNNVCVRESLAQDKRSRLRIVVACQARLQPFKKALAISLLVYGIRLLLIRMEKGLEKESAP